MGQGFRLDEVAPCLQRPQLARWLPARAYTDPEIAAAEEERIFRPGWHCIAVAAKLRNPGDYVATRLSGQRVLVVVGRDSRIRAFRNVCLHRGMWLAKGEGNVSSFTCPYHCWDYDLTGQLVNAPGMQKTEGFNAADMRLQEVRIEIWQGFVLGTLNENAQPYHQSLQAKELEQVMAPWNVPQLEVVIEKKYDIRPGTGRSCSRTAWRAIT